MERNGQGLLGIDEVGPFLEGDHACAGFDDFDKGHEMDVFAPGEFVTGLSACFL